MGLLEIGLLALIGLVTGLLSGLFGVGGGFLLVPALALLGWDLPNAIGTSLLYVALIGAGGAIQHFRARNLDVKFVAVSSVPAVAFAQGGALLTALFPEWALAVAFAGFLAYVGVTLGRARPAGEDAPPREARLGPTLGLGAVVGALSGFFGIGGGLVFVPAQVRYFHVPLKRAVGNSMAAVLLTGVSGVAAHAWLGHVRWVPGLVLVAGGLGGVFVGIRLLRLVPVPRLQRALAWFLLAMAGYMAVRGLWQLQP